MSPRTLWSHGGSPRRVGLMLACGLAMAGCLSLSARASRRNAAPPRNEPLGLLDSARDAVVSFTVAWRTAWEWSAIDSARYRADSVMYLTFIQKAGIGVPRPVEIGAFFLDVAPMCLDGPPDQRSGMNFIRAVGRAFCPVWTPGVVDHGNAVGWGASRRPAGINEQGDIDAAIEPGRLAGVRSARAHVIALLDSAAAVDPRSNWVAGQRVRFRLDQGDTAGATQVGQRCTADAWWCSALLGYVEYGLGHVAGADRLLQRAVADAPDSVHCAWTDLSLLLAGNEDPVWGPHGSVIPGPQAERTRYGRWPCGPQRDSVNALVWWLADPLLSDMGNERRAEHLAREVMLTLRSATPEASERWSWRLLDGGPGAKEMLLRYGWPTTSGWDGWVFDERRQKAYFCSTAPDTALARQGIIAACNAHREGQDFADSARMRAGLFPVYDAYAPGQVHAVPAFAAVENLLAAGDSTWSLYQPQLAPPATQCEDSGHIVRPEHPLDLPCLRVIVGPGRMLGIDRSRPFPAEFYRRARGPLLDIAFQSAMFRRNASVLLALATRLPSDSISHQRGGTSTGVLVFSPRPDSARTVAVTLPNDSATVVRGDIEPGRQLIGLEVAMTRAPLVTARLRVGVDAPAPLAELAPRAIDISAPALIGDGSGNPSADPIARMLPVIRVPRGALRLYWETYGVSPTDTVTFRIGVTSTAAPSPSGGLAAAVARLLGRPPAQESAPDHATVQWSEIGSRALSRPEEGPVPVLGWDQTVNLAGLTPGDYWVAVSVARNDASATSRRLIHVGKP